MKFPKVIRHRKAEATIYGKSKGFQSQGAATQKQVLEEGVVDGSSMGAWSFFLQASGRRGFPARRHAEAQELAVDELAAVVAVKLEQDKGQPGAEIPRTLAPLRSGRPRSTLQVVWMSRASG